MNTVRATQQALVRLKHHSRVSSSSSQKEHSGDVGGPRQSLAFGSTLPRQSAAAGAGGASPGTQSVAQQRASVASHTGLTPRQFVPVQGQSATVALTGTPGTPSRPSVVLPPQTAGVRQSVTAPAGEPLTPAGNGGTTPAGQARSSATVPRPEDTRPSFGSALPPGRGSLRAGDVSAFSARKSALVGAKRLSVTWANEPAASAAAAAAELTPEPSHQHPFGDRSVEPVSASVAARLRASAAAESSGRGADSGHRRLHRSTSNVSIRSSLCEDPDGADAKLLRQYSVFSQAAVRLAQRRTGGKAHALSEAAEPGEIRSTVDSIRRALFGSGPAPRVCVPLPYTRTAKHSSPNPFSER